VFREPSLISRSAALPRLRARSRAVPLKARGLDRRLPTQVSAPVPCTRTLPPKAGLFAGTPRKFTAEIEIARRGKGVERRSPVGPERSFFTRCAAREHRRRLLNSVSVVSGTSSSKPLSSTGGSCRLRFPGRATDEPAFHWTTSPFAVVRPLGSGVSLMMPRAPEAGSTVSWALELRTRQLVQRAPQSDQMVNRTKSSTVLQAIVRSK
jgi:hypothetical protein